jgi:hypothetical protein
MEAPAPAAKATAPGAEPGTPQAAATKLSPSEARRRAEAGARMRAAAQEKVGEAAGARQAAGERVKQARDRLGQAQSAIDERQAAGRQPTKKQTDELRIAKSGVEKAELARTVARKGQREAKTGLGRANEEARRRQALSDQAEAASAEKHAQAAPTALKSMWDTARKKLWKLWAQEEIAARKAGTSEAPKTEAEYDAEIAKQAAKQPPSSSTDAIDWSKTKPGIDLPGATQELNPLKALTDAQLEEVARTGQAGKFNAEVEHARIPQRVGKWLANAGVPVGEAASVSKLTDPGNLVPASKRLHEIVDESAARRRTGHNRDDPVSSLDNRATHPLADATDQEIGKIVEALEKHGADLDKKFDVTGNKDLQSWREILTNEKARRSSAKWNVP